MIRESTPRWYGHVKRLEASELVRWVMKQGTRKEDKWMDYMLDNDKVEDLDKVDDRTKWTNVSWRPSLRG